MPAGESTAPRPAPIKSLERGAWGAHLWRTQRARRVRPWWNLPNHSIADTRAMACMNGIVRVMEDIIEIGDTFKNPKFRDGRSKRRTLDRVVAPAQRGSAFSIAKPQRTASPRKEDNPMWNQDGFTEADYNADELNRFPSVASSRGSGNAGINKEKTVRQWFVDRSVLYLPEPSGASLTAREGCPKGERGGANQNFFYNTSAPGIVLFLHAAKPKARKGKVFLVNASQIFEKENPKNSIPHAGIQRIADHAELKKNDYNLSPSRYIHTSDAEEYRPIAEIVAELDAIEAEAKETDKALRKILKQLGV